MSNDLLLKMTNRLLALEFHVSIQRNGCSLPVHIIKYTLLIFSETCRQGRRGICLATRSDMYFAQSPFSFIGFQE